MYLIQGGETKHGRFIICGLLIFHSDHFFNRYYVVFNRLGGNMIYEVDFSIKIKSTFKTIYSAIVFADTVKECKEKASEIAKEKKLKNTNVYIQEFIIS